MQELLNPLGNAFDILNHFVNAFAVAVNFGGKLRKMLRGRVGVAENRPNILFADAEQFLKIAQRLFAGRDERIQQFDHLLNLRLIIHEHPIQRAGKRVHLRQHAPQILQDALNRFGVAFDDQVNIFQNGIHFFLIVFVNEFVGVQNQLIGMFGNFHNVRVNLRKQIIHVFQHAAHAGGNGIDLADQFAELQDFCGGKHVIGGRVRLLQAAFHDF